MMPGLLHRCECLRSAVNAINTLAPGERWMLKTLVTDLVIDLGAVRDDPDAEAWWCAAVLVRCALGPSPAPDVWARAIASMPPIASMQPMASASAPAPLPNDSARPRFTEVPAMGLESD
jgi:hypothetical protein